MAHETQITGRQSELTAIKALMTAGWEVAEPVVGEAYDLVAKSPRSDVWVRIQVKTVRRRDDRGGAAVVYATKANGQPYTEDEVDYFAGVDGDDVYLILNRRKREYWKPTDNARINPQRKSAWIKLEGPDTDYTPWLTAKSDREAV